MSMPLPSAWVDRIHARLLVRYGAAWIRKWEGVPMEAVKADWGEVLGNASREAISHALDCLPPDLPPTATQFRDLCRGVPSKAPAITHDRPAPNPERLAQLREKLTSIGTPANEREMAERVFARLRIARDTGTDPETGRKVSAAQLDFLERAERGLNGGSPLATQAGAFTPPPEHTLPPGMRKDAS